MFTFAFTLFFVVCSLVEDNGCGNRSDYCEKISMACKDIFTFYGGLTKAGD